VEQASCLFRSQASRGGACPLPFISIGVRTGTSPVPTKDRYSRLALKAGYSSRLRATLRAGSGFTDSDVGGTDILSVSFGRGQGLSLRTPTCGGRSNPLAQDRLLRRPMGSSQ